MESRERVRLTDEERDRLYDLTRTRKAWVRTVRQSGGCFKAQAQAVADVGASHSLGRPGLPLAVG